METKLKKSNFVKFSDNPSLNHNVIKMLHYSWNEILTNPDVVSADSFTTTQLHTLASLNLEYFAQTGLDVSEAPMKGTEPVRYIAKYVIGDVRNELKSMIRQKLVVS